MLDYLLLQRGIGVLRSRAPMRVTGDVTIVAPAGATVFWNGKAFTATADTVTIPAACVRARNAVRIVSGGESYRCEGVGFDRDAVLLALAEAVVSVIGTLDDLAAYVLAERQRRETGLFA